ncbi:DUF2800 domain-containing protein [Serratia symbiotica]|nr:DUF2800 domain-containing protein [Serratia symbiotica]
MAEETLKALRRKGNPIYTQKLISPPQTEKLFKSGGISERFWKKLEHLSPELMASPLLPPNHDP